jgi:uncharacterized damage-inducible protein DinB
MNDQWRAPEIERSEVSRRNGEREMLDAWLDYHRETLLWKCSGLTADQLTRRSVPPSELTLLGLVRHMTDVETWWFRIHAAGETDATFLHSSDDNEEGDFDFDQADVRANLEAFWETVDAARQATRDIDLDDVMDCPHHGHPESKMSVRWIFTHMLEEYARHNGHADLLREAIDGSTGE